MDRLLTQKTELWWSDFFPLHSFESKQAGRMTFERNTRPKTSVFSYLKKLLYHAMVEITLQLYYMNYKVIFNKIVY